MDKSPDAFRTISEVAEALDTPAHVLRFWETRFPQIRPVKRAGGRRYYRPSDLALLIGIKRLLHEEGMTIRGVQKVLREQGVRHVAGLSDEISPEEEALISAMTSPPAAAEVTRLAPRAPSAEGRQEADPEADPEAIQPAPNQMDEQPESLTDTAASHSGPEADTDHASVSAGGVKPGALPKGGQSAEVIAFPLESQTEAPLDLLADFFLPSDAPSPVPPALAGPSLAGPSLAAPSLAHPSLAPRAGAKDLFRKDSSLPAEDPRQISFPGFASDTGADDSRTDDSVSGDSVPDDARPKQASDQPPQGDPAETYRIAARQAAENHDLAEHSLAENSLAEQADNRAFTDNSHLDHHDEAPFVFDIDDEDEAAPVSATITPFPPAAAPADMAPSEPITPEPVTPEPMTSGPVTSEPMTSGPVTSEPVSPGALAAGLQTEATLPRHSLAARLRALPKGALTAQRDRLYPLAGRIAALRERLELAEKSAR
ncbi:MerR family transcriptional regulator [Pseudogemmobacter hezensis]|uniref:MerR family transcriptional regulator n=1 Tax=Pseudogemmobacter hezensis TaxID=2737662 RepID=UPI0020A65C8C|nr:MerR family transcriptional regulator [Pseudogemmobacter hezensis]